MGPRPIFPVLHRRRVLPTRRPARALAPEPLAQAARRQAGAAAGPRACGWRTKPVRYAARISSGSRSTPRCSRRPSPFRPMPSCCMPSSKGSIAWREATASGCGNPILALPGPRQCWRPCQAIQAAVAHPARPAEQDHPRIRRKMEGQAVLENTFALPLGRASQIRSQQQRQRTWKLYSFHAPEVECIGKSKAAAPYEFNNRRSPGFRLVLHASALPDNPYDGHTLRDVIDRTETLTGCAIERAMSTRDTAATTHKIPVASSSPARSAMSCAIKRELRRRSAIEPIIRHLKGDGHLGRSYLKGRATRPTRGLLHGFGQRIRLLSYVSLSNRLTSVSAIL